MILAAGLGTRLKWLTRQRPKALAPVAGEACIARVIRRLVGVGVRDIAINLHHHGEAIRDALGDGARLGARLYYSHEPRLLDSGGGFRQAAALLPDGERILLHNADILADADLIGLEAGLGDASCALLMVDNPRHRPGGDFSVRGDRLDVDGGARLTYGGISCWRRDVVLRWPRGRAFSLVEPMLHHARRGDARAWRHRGYWFDIGRPRDLFRADRFLSARS